jgi:hypothetical protein
MTRSREEILEILSLFFEGKLSSRKKPFSKILQHKGPRANFTTPQERGGHNYGYMQIDELLAGTPFVDKE